MTANGETFDEVITIGPLIMMKFVALTTKQYNIPTDASLNTIMVDGTVQFANPAHGGKQFEAEGITVSKSGSVLSINADKGDYMLKTASAKISDLYYIPQNIEMNANDVTDDKKVEITWDELSECRYDIEINGKTEENVTSPYIITTTEDDHVYNVTITAKINDVRKSVTKTFNYAWNDHYSFVKFD